MPQYPWCGAGTPDESTCSLASSSCNKYTDEIAPVPRLSASYSFENKSFCSINPIHVVVYKLGVGMLIFLEEYNDNQL